MKKPIIVFGAGRSSSALFSYLQSWFEEENLRFTIADLDEPNLKKQTEGRSQSDPALIDPSDSKAFLKLTQQHQLAISLLPPHIHMAVAQACLESGCHLLTASYESEEMRSLADAIKNKGLIFMNECGLDPGIDHMSAMDIIHKLKEKGATIHKFFSFCGGLVADECDSNPYKYKISWNPRNVVTAGRGTSKYLKNNKEVLLPYHRLFREIEQYQVEGWGEFEGYANRNSLPYKELYGLNQVKDLKRGTLRKPGFCSKWDTFVQLGCTDTESELSFSVGSSYLDYIQSFLPDFDGSRKSFENNRWLRDARFSDWEFMGFTAANRLELKRLKGSPADYLQDLIVEKWALSPGDKDLVVMLHIFEYTLEGIDYQLISSMGLKGQSQDQTAMALTVGLPLGMVAKRILLGKFSHKGLLLPLDAQLYRPVLQELAGFGVHFNETISPLK